MYLTTSDQVRELVEKVRRVNEAADTHNKFMECQTAFIEILSQELTEAVAGGYVIQEPERFKEVSERFSQFLIP